MTGKWDNDEYVANLLKEDARNAAKTYELVGIDAFKHKKRAGVPKPNTNFLRHIIRQTDSHNAALLAKEAEEARARFRSLNGERGKQRRRRDNGPKDKTHGRLTPVFSEDDVYQRSSERRSKYIKDEDGRDTIPSRRAREGSKQGTHNIRTDRSREKRRDEKQPGKKRRNSSDEDRYARKRRHRHSRDEHDERARRSGHRDHQRGRGKSTSRSPSISRSHRSYRQREQKKRQDRSTTPQYAPIDSRSRSLSPVRRNDSRKLYRRSGSLNSDSDPLESLVGPLPPSQGLTVQARGRGAQKANATNMDSRFSAKYDPTSDVCLESDAEDEWGDALEAFRDRQRWKQQGASRLKAAGFTETQIQKWEKGSHPTEDDVVWAGRGQAREWDRGKLLGEDGHIELKADFGRLK